LLDPDNSVSPLSVAVLEARDRVGGRVFRHTSISRCLTPSQSAG
jgi:monoamine oxidase